MRFLVNSVNNMSPKKSIDAIIIAKNESQRLAICIKRLSFVRRVYVIDNGSTDRTASVAKKAGAHVLKSDAKNFAAIRNLGAKTSNAHWLLYVDADEFVSLKLASEIIGTVEIESSIKAYRILRDNYYLGHLWPTHDGMVRLIHKESLIRWSGNIHEQAHIEGQIGVLHHHLVHDTHRTLHEMTEKTNDWSEIEARLRYDAHHPPIVQWRLLRVMVTGFFASYIREGGWKMGTVGMIESIFQSFSMFTTYAKLWELQQAENINKRISK